jgi:hypothetical protein
MKSLDIRNEALAKPEPVAYFCSRTNAVSTNSHHRTDENWTPLYTSPRKEWKELTHAQISLMISSHTSLTDLCRTVEAKLKEKNT